MTMSAFHSRIKRVIVRRFSSPIHDDHIEYLTDWSIRNTTRKDCDIRVQSGFVCDDNRPEPDILWLRPRRYGRTRSMTADAFSNRRIHVLSDIINGRYRRIEICVPPNHLAPTCKPDAHLKTSSSFAPQNCVNEAFFRGAKGDDHRIDRTMLA